MTSTETMIVASTMVIAIGSQATRKSNKIKVEKISTEIGRSFFS